MKLPRTNSIQPKTVVIVTVGIAILLAAAGYAYYHHTKTTSTSPTTGGASKIDLSPPTDNQKTAGDEAKQRTVDSTKSSTTPSPQPSSLAVTITSINQSDSTFSIRSLIDTVTNQGTCTLTLTKDTSTVTKTAGIQPLANSSTCKGFDVAKSSLSSGIWHLVLSVSTGAKTGSVSKDVTIN